MTLSKLLKPLRNWTNTVLDVHQLTNTFLTTISLFFVTFFALWWFMPAHIPNNFVGHYRIFDVILFILVSYVIWHPITMDILTWAISSHIKDVPKKDPQPGLKVAFITTIVPSSEPLELLHKCLPAMVQANYEHDTWLLDEGDNPLVKKICEQYGVKHFSRASRNEYNTPNGKYTKTKGGNHNSWYDEFGNNYDIVAQVDTDFVPEADFLTQTLGYFRDPKVAFVGTPQIYGNIKESLIARGAAEQQYSFYGTVLRGLSGMGTTLLIGANHVIRVAALKDVNHYSAHITEDLLTGMKLHTNKWKSVYLPYALAVGEGPTTWIAYFNQQMRWAYGCMDILFHHTPKLFKKMDMRRRIYYFFLQQHYFSGIAMAVSILLLAIYFFTGLRAADIDLVRFFLSYTLIQLMCWLMSVWLQHFHIPREDESKLLLAGMVINIAVWPIWFLAFLCALTQRRLTYKVTPKGDHATKSDDSISVFIPHIVLGFTALLGVLSSFFTHRQNIAMLFWAICSMIILFFVPMAQSFDSIFKFIKLSVKQRIQKLIETYGSKNRNSKVEKYSINKEGVLYDSIFLSLVVLISLLFYVGKIGFYSDDWSFLSNFTYSSNHSLWGLIQTATTPNTFMRPGQNILDAVLFWMFGTHPLGYHIFNAGLLLLITNTFYHILRRLRLPRIITVTIPLVFILLPQYSADRFWYAAFQANLSLFFYLVSLYSGLTGIITKNKSRIAWTILSLLTLIFSALSYEVALPLFLLNLVFFWNPLKKFIHKNESHKQDRSVFIVLTIVVLLYSFLFKALTTTRLSAGSASSALLHPNKAVQLFSSAFQVNYITLGLHFPFVAFDFFQKYTNPLLIITSVLLGLGIFTYLSTIISEQKYSFPNKFWMTILFIFSFVIFFLGYAIFLTNGNVAFSPTGIANRVAIAASMGIACTIVASIGWLTRLMRNENWANQAFCLGIALTCSLGFITINTLSTFWIEAYNQQQIVLADIKENVPTIPLGSTLILDNVCPYVGPATVFESEWDLKGALQIIYKDPSLQANIANDRLKIYVEGLGSQIYNLTEFYPYEKVFVYNYSTKQTYPIPNIEAAELYFKTVSQDHKTECPAGSEGNGVSVI